MGRQLRAEQRTAQHPDRHMGALAGVGLHRAAGVVAKVINQLHHVLREGVAAPFQPHRAHHMAVAAGRAAKPKVDAVRIERRQRAELFGNR